MLVRLFFRRNAGCGGSMPQQSTPSRPPLVEESRLCKQRWSQLHSRVVSYVVPSVQRQGLRPGQGPSGRRGIRQRRGGAPSSAGCSSRRADSCAVAGKARSSRLLASAAAATAATAAHRHLLCPLLPCRRLEIGQQPQATGAWPYSGGMQRWLLRLLNPTSCMKPRHR